MSLRLSLMMLDIAEREDLFALLGLPYQKRLSPTMSSGSLSRSSSPTSSESSSSRPSIAQRALMLGLTTSKKGEPLTQAQLAKHIDILERVEAMDMSDEEIAEALVAAPWHVTRWLGKEVNQGAPSSSIDHNFRNASGKFTILEPKIKREGNFCKDDSVSDVNPSNSGANVTSELRKRTMKDSGSELDSEYDEFEEPATQFADGFRLEGDIPQDEYLEESEINIIVAVEKAMDDAAEQLSESNSYDWQEHFEYFRGIPERFIGPTPGPVKDYDSPYDAFTDLWSHDIMESIANEINRSAQQSSSRGYKWTPTDADEIAILFAVYMYMSMSPRTSQIEYWKSNGYLEMPMFRSLMPYSRYFLLNKFLYFVDNSNMTQSKGDIVSPLVVKLTPIINNLNMKFSALYNLDSEISIGHLTLRTKAEHFGIKLFELCESHTGYLHKFQVYAGINSALQIPSDDSRYIDMGSKTTKVVTGLVQNLTHRGHRLALSNFYNSPALARYLKSKGFDCFGTLRTTRRNVPVEIGKVSESSPKGTIVARHCGDVSIITWKDTRVVNMISTWHTDETYVEANASNIGVVKPICVRDYSSAMIGVAQRDQRLATYLLERKPNVKWYVKMFMRLLNVSIHNAFLMTVCSLTRRDKLSMTHREFRYELAKSLSIKHSRSRLMSTQPEGTDIRLRTDITHRPKHQLGKKNRKPCTVCYGKGINKMVQSQCVTCNKFMCFEICWEEWHSLAELKSR